MAVNLTQYRNRTGDLLLDFCVPLAKHTKFRVLVEGKAQHVEAYLVWMLDDNAFACERDKASARAEEKEPLRLTYVSYEDARRWGLETIDLRLPDPPEQDDTYFSVVVPHEYKLPADTAGITTTEEDIPKNNQGNAPE